MIEPGNELDFNFYEHQHYCDTNTNYDKNYNIDDIIKDHLPEKKILLLIDLIPHSVDLIT